MKHLNCGDMKRVVLPSPPVEEQRAIAATLSDVDALMEGLTRVIAKKRDLKQAAMQQLLTGQTRLRQLNAAWTVRRLGEVLSICHGKSQKGIEAANGPFPVLATGGQIGTASRWLYDKPSVLIGRKGTIDQPQYMATPFWTVDTLFFSVMKGDNLAKFFYYRFWLINWMQHNEASGVPSLNARTIESIEVACPEPTEQAAIAGVLSDMDAEVDALEARRDKTRALKQAMMQELLTGRTRLV
jgi:type I restriction enzyme S subunit